MGRWVVNVSLQILSEVCSSVDFKLPLHEHINNVSFIFLHCTDPHPFEESGELLLHVRMGYFWHSNGCSPDTKCCITRQGGIPCHVIRRSLSFCVPDASSELGWAILSTRTWKLSKRNHIYSSHVFPFHRGTSSDFLTLFLLVPTQILLYSWVIIHMLINLLSCKPMCLTFC